MAESVYIPPHLKKYFLPDSDKISIPENVTKPENVYNNSEHDKPMMNNKNH